MNNIKLNWQYFQQFSWIQNLKDCPQDPIHHAEGNVWIHTEMVLDCLKSMEAYKQLSQNEQEIVFLACLMHDIGKPSTTKFEDNDRISSKGHSKVGELMSRKILWELNVSFEQREMICGLIKFHQVPFFLIEKEHLEAKKVVVETSLIASNKLLSIVAEADIRGRICQDLQKILDNIELFKEFCQEEKCYDNSKYFPDDHTRYCYFNNKLIRFAETSIYDNTEFTVYMMSGLPGSGKNTYIEKYLSNLSTVCLDDLRLEFGISATDNQGQIIQEAKERVKEFLRKKQSFIWNATSINKMRREPILQLFKDYNAKIEIIYLESPKDKLLIQNNNRKTKVPESVIEGMSSKWEVPTLLECHKLTKIINGN